MADEKVASFVWTVKNFDMLPHLADQYLSSPEFRIGFYRLRLKLYPRLYPKYISAFLERMYDCGAKEILIKFETSIGDEKKVLTNFVDIENIFTKHSEWGWNEFIDRDKILTIWRNTLLPNNNLSINCEVLSLSVNKSIEDHLNDDQDAEILSSEFGAILSSGIYSDMVLVVDEDRFNVHKVILECRCKNLMSQLKATEVLNEYTLFGVDGPTLRILLQYLYTGTFSISNLYEEMLVASETYDIPDLKHLLTFPYNKTVRAETEVAVSKQSFKWMIKEFSKLHLKQELVYPAFYNTADDWSKMKLILTCIKDKNGLNGIGLKFRKLSTSKVDFIRCKISIYTNLKTTVKEYEHIFTSGADWITPLGSEIELQQILFNDTLNMFFETSVSKNEINSKIESISVETKTDKPGGEVMKYLELLQEDFQSLYDHDVSKSANIIFSSGDDDEPQSADITLSVGDVKYPAHKIIMCARSPVFAKMFEKDTLEKKEGLVNIEDLDAETVSSMLRYIYSGYIDSMDISEAIKLYSAADKYELLILNEKCATFLKTSMDADHIGEILLLADAHHDDDLRRCVYDYMISNPKKVRQSTDGLSFLKNRLDVYPDIVNALLDHMSLKGSE